MDESNSLLDTVLLEAGPCARRDQLRGKVLVKNSGLSVRQLLIQGDDIS
jgi:hypothetical protein